MKQFFTAMAILLLLGCATKIENPSANLADQQMVLNSVVEEGLARIHFYLGKTEMYGKEILADKAIEIFINNQSVGIVGNKNEFIVVELYPGEYSFTWKSINTTDRGYEKPSPLILKINERDLIFLEAISSLDPGPLGAFGGLITAATMKFYPTFKRSYAMGQQQISQKRLTLRNTTIKDFLTPLKAKTVSKP